MMNAGEKVERTTIVNAMQRCNDADQAILDYENSFKDYMKSRDAALVDCDHTCGDPKIDAWHDELRKQYQEIYGKDVKHG